MRYSCKRWVVALMAVGLAMGTSGCAMERWLVSQFGNIHGEWVHQEYQPGTGQLSFFKDGTYEYDFTGDGKRDVWGKFNKANTVLILRDEAGPAAACTMPGVYYTNIERNLFMGFTLVVDPCEARITAMSHKWHKILDSADKKENQPVSVKTNFSSGSAPQVNKSVSVNFTWE